MTPNLPAEFRILILKLGALGDVVRTSYLLPGLHERFGPGTSVTWVTSPAALPILRCHPLVANLISVDQLTNPESKSLLYGAPFDWVLSLDDEIESCGIATQVTANRISGAFPAAGGISYTEDTRPWFDMGLISRFGKATADQLKIANQESHDAIFGKMLGVTIDRPTFYNDPASESAARDRLHSFPRKIVGLNLSAGRRWPSKSLRLTEAARLVDLLRKLGATCLLLGGHDDLPYLEAVRSSRELPMIHSLSLAEFAGVIGELDLLVTSDTLALHLAIAQRVPSVSYYSPTSAAEINTFASGAKVASLSPDYCSYCPDADNSTITAERLIAEAHKYLELPTKATQQ